MRRRMAKAFSTGLVSGLLLTAAACPASAQGGTDIWVATFHEVGTHVSIGRPVNVTRRAGYDNQPAFTLDGRSVLFTSTREDAQADIWRVGIAGGTQTRVTSTPESEYSATPMPNGRGFSVIRVERDSTQRLWQFPWDGGEPSLVLRALRPVGYHVWVGETTLGAFVLAQRDAPRAPNALVVVDPRSERADTVARGIGRALVRVPGRSAFSFLQLGGDTAWIAEVDTRTNSVRRLAPNPERSEYHFWTPSGQLVASSGTRLLLRVGDRWDVLADFAELGVKGISRLALSPTGDRLAFVAEDGAP